MAADFADHEFVKEDVNDFDVIIIGAGLSGLTCAYNILRKKAGLDVLIIEENNEVGGRILPKVLSQTYHANFLQQHITDLIESLRINVKPGKIINTREKILYSKSGPSRNLPKYYGAEIYSFLDMIETEALSLVLNNYTDNETAHLAETSVEDMLRKYVYFSFARLLCRAYICSTCAMRNLNDVSALWLLVTLNGASGLFNRLRITIGDDNRFFIQGGVIKIAQELLRNILRLNGKIRYQETVNEVKFNDDRVYVFTEKSSLRCNLAVIAVPPPEHNRIAIEPSSQCLLNTQILYTPGKNIFFNVVYKNRYSNNDSIKDIVTTWDLNSNLNIAYNVTHSKSENSMLSGFLAEPNSTQTSRKELFDTLHECFKSEETSEYLQYTEYDHFLNGEMKGGSPMSVLMPTLVNHVSLHTGTAFGRNVLRSSGAIIDRFLNNSVGTQNSVYRMINKVFFASSEYATNWPGTIDGAIEAGKFTAYSLLYRIRPQTLTAREIASFKLDRTTRKEPAPFKIFIIQYIGLVLNLAVFWSFLKSAYNNT